MKKIRLPLTKSMIKALKVGDQVLLSGKIYTARDAAHKRLYGLIKKGKRLPISLANNVIYYCGPTPARPGEVIGSCGPTTSKRMDKYTPDFLEKGLSAMIGKGSRSEDVIKSIKKNKALYLITVGGAGAFLSGMVKASMAIAYRGLGPEAIYELEVEDFPVIVAVDSKGMSIYKLRDEGVDYAQ